VLAKILIRSQAREDELRSVLRFEVKLQKLPLDRRKKRDDPESPSGVVFGLTRSDDRDPLRIPSDIVPP
jgi:hypothetical protein